MTSHGAQAAWRPASRAPGPVVSAALANWNGAAYLPRCLECLYAQSQPPDEVVVVDNGSRDGSPAWIRDHYPRVHLLVSAHNEGYCAGYNRAIAATGAPYVLVLNTDVYLDAGFLEAAAAVLERDSAVAAVTGRFYEQGTDRTISGGFYLRRQVRMRPAAPADGEVEVFGASGAAVLFRRTALEEAAEDGQIYDPRYHSYGEDIDLSWRLRTMGWSLRYTPAARAHHVGSGSLGGALRFLDKPAPFQRHALKNRYLTVLKNAPGPILLEMGAALLLTDLLLWPYLCLRQPLRVPYLLGAIVDVFRLLPSSWTRRRALRRRARCRGEAVRPWLRGL